MIQHDTVFQPDLIQLGHTPGGNEVVVRNPFHPAMLGEAERPFSDEHQVFAAVHDQAGELDRVGNIGNSGHSACGQVAAIHDAGIHLHLAVLGKHRPASSVEQGIILQVGGAGLHRFHGPDPAG